MFLCLGIWLSSSLPFIHSFYVYYIFFWHTFSFPIYITNTLSLHCPFILISLYKITSSCQQFYFSLLYFLTFLLCQNYWPPNSVQPPLHKSPSYSFPFSHFVHCSRQYTISSNLLHAPDHYLDLEAYHRLPPCLPLATTS